MKRKINILMVEDSPTDAQLITNSLQRGDFEVEIKQVETRDAFLHELQEHRPDVILSDHGLPAFDGLAALSLAREKRPDVPFIVVTGSAGDRMTLEALNRGADAFVSKDQLAHLVPKVKRSIEFAEKRAHLEQALAEIEERFQLLEEGVRDSVIYLLDPEGRVIWWDVGGTEIYGFENQEILGKHVSLLCSSEGKRLQIAGELLEKAVREGRVEQEGTHLRKNGIPFRASTVITALKDRAGQLRGFAVVARDLTEQRRTVRALQLKQAQEEAWLGVVTDAFISLDRNGVLTEWNAAAEAIFGFRREEALGREFLELLIPESRRRELRGKLEEFLASTEDRQFGREAMMLRSDGTELTVEFALALIQTSGPRRFIGYIRDVTRIKEAAAALVESEARYRMMVESVTDYGIYMLDAAGRVATWNAGAERLEGYKAEEIIGRHFSVFFTPEDLHAGRPEQELRTAETLGRSFNEGMAVRKGGTTFWSEWALTAVRDAEGKITGFCRVAHDISAQREAEKALRESEEKLKAIVRSARDYAIFTTDLDRRISSWSAGAELMFGYKESEIIGQDIAVLFSTEYRLAGHVENELRTALENGHIGNECWHVREGGEHFWGSGTTAPLRNSSGQTIGYLKIIQDQTGRRLMQGEIQSHVRQQAAVAKFGERALAVTEVDTLMADAASLIAENLETPLCAVLEYLPEANFLVFRKGVGWKSEVEQRVTLSAGVDFDVGYTLNVREPIVVGDPTSESRFQVSPVFRDRGVVSGIGVVLEGEHQPFGIIVAHSDRPRRFSEYDVHFIESMASVLALAIRRRRMEEALHKSEERLRLAVEAIEDYAIYMLDAQGRITSWNVGAKRIEGYRPSEILGQPWSIFFTPEDVASGLPDQEIERARTEGRAQAQTWAVRKDGSRFLVDWVLTPIRGAHGQITGFVKVAHDVTERKKTEEELRRSEERFRLAVEVVQDYGIYMLDAEGRVATYNLGAERIEGYRGEEIIGQPLHVFFTSEDIANGVPDRELERARNEGKSQGEGWNVRKDGSRFLSNWVLTAVRDEQGNLTGYSKVARDVTELRRTEEKIQHWNVELEQRVAQRTRELEAANKELEAFSYSVSHDLRAPLRHISAFIHLLEQNLGARLEGEDKQYLNAVAESARHMGELVDDLLTFSRMGRQNMRRVPVDLGALVREAQAHLKTEIDERDIEWVIGPLPRVEGDPVTLQQVMINLLSNALKYTASRPRARIEIGSSTSEQETTCFVRDNGVGFDMRYAHKLFGVFQRLHSQNEFEGTGIGLAIVRRVIQRHGGRAWAEAALNQGATFYFSLPHSGREGEAAS